MSRPDSLVLSNRVRGEDWVLAVLPITAYCDAPLDAVHRDVNLIVEVATCQCSEPR